MENGQGPDIHQFDKSLLAYSKEIFSLEKLNQSVINKQHKEREDHGAEKLPSIGANGAPKLFATIPGSAAEAKTEAVMDSLSRTAPPSSHARRGGSSRQTMPASSQGPRGIAMRSVWPVGGRVISPPMAWSPQRFGDQAHYESVDLEPPTAMRIMNKLKILEDFIRGRSPGDGCLMAAPPNGDSLSRRLDNIETRLEQREGSSTRLEQRLTKSEQAGRGPRGSAVADAEARVTEIVERVKKLKTAMMKLDSRVETGEVRVGEVHAGAEASSRAIAGRVVALEAGFGAMRAASAEAKGSKGDSSIEARIDALRAALEERLSEFSASAQAAQAAGVEAQEELRADLEAQLSEVTATLQSKEESETESVAVQQQRIEDLEKQVESLSAAAEDTAKQSAAQAETVMSRLAALEAASAAEKPVDDATAKLQEEVVALKARVEQQQAAIEEALAAAKAVASLKAEPSTATPANPTAGEAEAEAEAGANPSSGATVVEAENGAEAGAGAEAEAPAISSSGATGVQVKVEAGAGAEPAPSERMVEVGAEAEGTMPAAAGAASAQAIEQLSARLKALEDRPAEAATVALRASTEVPTSEEVYELLARVDALEKRPFPQAFAAPTAGQDPAEGAAPGPTSPGDLDAEVPSRAPADVAPSVEGVEKLAERVRALEDSAAARRTGSAGVQDPIDLTGLKSQLEALEGRLQVLDARLTAWEPVEGAAQQRSAPERAAAGEPPSNVECDPVGMVPAPENGALSVKVDNLADELHDRVSELQEKMSNLLQLIVTRVKALEGAVSGSIGAASQHGAASQRAAGASPETAPQPAVTSGNNGSTSGGSEAARGKFVDEAFVLEALAEVKAQLSAQMARYEEVSADLQASAKLPDHSEEPPKLKQLEEDLSGVSVRLFEIEGQVKEALDAVAAVAKSAAARPPSQPALPSSADDQAPGDGSGADGQQQSVLMEQRLEEIREDGVARLQDMHDKITPVLQLLVQRVKQLEGASLSSSFKAMSPGTTSPPAAAPSYSDGTVETAVLDQRVTEVHSRMAELQSQTTSTMERLQEMEEIFAERLTGMQAKITNVMQLLVQRVKALEGIASQGN